MAATQDSSQYIRKISFCFKCSYEYFRCEDYAISLLEQCENLQEVETFLQTTNSGIKVVYMRLVVRIHYNHSYWYIFQYECIASKKIILILFIFSFFHTSSFHISFHAYCFFLPWTHL